MTNPPILDGGYAGWWRPKRGVPWTRLAIGDDYSTTWGATLDALASVHGGESLVLRLNQSPNARPRCKAPTRRGKR